MLVLRPARAVLVRPSSSYFIAHRLVQVRRHASMSRDAFKQDVENTNSPAAVLADYRAPLSKTFYRLKAFSLSSLCAAIGLTPALLFAPAEVGLGGRIGLCATALATSGASTAIFAWIGKPYVGGMRLLSAEAARALQAKDAKDESLPLTDSMRGVRDSNRGPAIEALTTDWRLRGLKTLVFEPSLIRPTSRPLATWELTLSPPTPENSADFPVTKLVASTHLAKTGQLVGRQWVTWPQKGVQGRSVIQGTLVRHYSIHEELLDEKWKIL